MGNTNKITPLEIPNFHNGSELDKPVTLHILNPQMYKICLICLENIENEKWCTCVKCNIILHNLCEEKYRNEKKYCKCPYCYRIGTLCY